MLICTSLFQLQARLDNAEDTILVDTPLDIDPRTKNKKSEDKSEDKVVEEVVKKNEKISPDEFGKNEITFYRNDILDFCIFTLVNTCFNKMFLYHFSGLRR